MVDEVRLKGSNDGPVPDPHEADKLGELVYANIPLTGRLGSVIMVKS